jgi:hypothetical protein
MGRLEHDRAIVFDLYPRLAFSCDRTTRRLELAGAIRLFEEETGQPTDLQIRLVFPPDYPLHEPKVYQEGSRFPRDKDRHINADGSFCLWLEPLSRWDKADANALLVLLERVSVFCEDQLAYEVLGRFPYGEWAHFDAGYAEFLFEALGRNYNIMAALAARPDQCALPDRNDSCLCGSGRKFKKCHMTDIVDALHRLGSEHFRTAVSAWQRSSRTGIETSLPPSSAPQDVVPTELE